MGWQHWHDLLTCGMCEGAQLTKLCPKNLGKGHGNTDKTYKHAACLPSGVHSSHSFDQQFWSWDGNTDKTYKTCGMSPIRCSTANKVSALEQILARDRGRETNGHMWKNTFFFLLNNSGRADHKYLMHAFLLPILSYAIIYYLLVVLGIRIWSYSGFFAGSAISYQISRSGSGFDPPITNQFRNVNYPPFLWLSLLIVSKFGKYSNCNNA
jgi:hypothetical protein